MYSPDPNSNGKSGETDSRNKRKKEIKTFAWPTIGSVCMSIYEYVQWGLVLSKFYMFPFRIGVSTKRRMASRDPNSQEALGSRKEKNIHSTERTIPPPLSLGEYQFAWRVQLGWSQAWAHIFYIFSFELYLFTASTQFSMFISVMCAAQSSWNDDFFWFFLLTLFIQDKYILKFEFIYWRSLFVRPFLKLNWCLI